MTGAYRIYNRRKLGEEQESLAVSYLEANGYEIIQRNFYCKAGEIDIIAKQEEYLVFIEIRFRSSVANGYPEESVTKRKQNRIIQSARYYMYKMRLSEDTPVRFDVVAILGTRFRLIKNAFETR